MNAFLGFITIFIVMGSLLSLIFLMTKIKSKSDREEEEKLRKSLEDEYITDPETGIKLTLEEAESGHWIAHDNEFLTVPDSEIEDYDNENVKIAERAINYLKESKEYRKFEISDRQFDIISNSQILNQLSDWTYSNIFVLKGGVLLLINPEYETVLGTYSETNLMYWLKIKNINGHYYFREKTSTEIFFDRIKNDDEFHLTGYECFTIKKSSNVILIKRILLIFENQHNLIIELKDDNLFIKTTRMVNLDDINRIQKIINQVNSF